MASKVLLGFNAAAIFGAYFLYSAGVRVVLDDGYEMLPSLVDFPPAAPRPSSPSSWGGAGEKNNYTCTNLRMQPKFLSFDPIMVYIEDFMSPYETQHLRKLAESQYARTYHFSLSSVVENYGDGDAEVKNMYIDTSQRKSETAWLADGDAVVDCVKARAAEFQGFAPNHTMEELAVLKYTAGGSFTTHYDWHRAAPQPVDRRTSFFATLAASADIEGGATWFPLVERPAWSILRPWCQGGWLDCGYESGLAVRPVPGNALFWVNFREDGSGHEETAHGGQPVLRGSKIGLNIWTKARLRP